MNDVSKNSQNTTVMKNENLENDSFFYERKQELHQIRTDIKSGKSKLMSFDDFEEKTNKLEKELEIKYATQTR